MILKRYSPPHMKLNQLELLSFFIIELCLVEYKMLKFPPSLLAASAIYTAQCSLYFPIKQWSKTSEWYSNYSEDQLLWVFSDVFFLKKKKTFFEFEHINDAIMMFTFDVLTENAQNWWSLSIRRLELGNLMPFIGSTVHGSLAMQQKLNQLDFF